MHLACTHLAVRLTQAGDAAQLRLPCSPAATSTVRHAPLCALAPASVPEQSPPASVPEQSAVVCRQGARDGAVSCLGPRACWLCRAGEARETGLVPGAPPNADGLLGLAPVGRGHIGIYGDSGCLDSSHQRSSCYNMLKAMIAYVATVSTCMLSSGCAVAVLLRCVCWHTQARALLRCVMGAVVSQEALQSWSVSRAAELQLLNRVRSPAYARRRRSRALQLGRKPRHLTAILMHIQWWQILGWGQI